MFLISAASHGIKHELSGRFVSMGKIATVHAESHRMEKNDEKYPGHYISIGLPTLLIPQALLVKVFITDEECLVKTFAFVNAALLAMSGHLMQISKPQKAKKNIYKNLHFFKQNCSRSNYCK